MKSEIKYIELKSKFSDDGPAWIGLVSFSKSGKTSYFNGKAFQSLGGQGIYSNFYEIETGEEYWISGVKKNMSDRHQFGSGKIMVEKRILNDYLQIVGLSELPKTGYELTEVDTEKPIERIHELENEKLAKNKFGDDLFHKNPIDLTNEQLKHLISELTWDEQNYKFNKGRRATKKKRVEFERELQKREEKTV